MKDNLKRLEQEEEGMKKSVDSRKHNFHPPSPLNGGTTKGHSRQNSRPDTYQVESIMSATEIVVSDERASSAANVESSRNADIDQLNGRSYHKFSSVTVDIDVGGEVQL